MLEVYNHNQTRYSVRSNSILLTLVSLSLSLE